MAETYRVRVALGTHQQRDLSALVGLLSHLEPEVDPGPPATLELHVSAWTSTDALDYVSTFLSRIARPLPTMTLSLVLDLEPDHATSSTTSRN